jgi:hypothetical protein
MSLAASSTNAPADVVIFPTAGTVSHVLQMEPMANSTFEPRLPVPHHRSPSHPRRPAHHRHLLCHATTVSTALVLRNYLPLYPLPGSLPFPHQPLPALAVEEPVTTPPRTTGLLIAGPTPS